MRVNEKKFIVRIRSYYSPVLTFTNDMHKYFSFLTQKKNASNSYGIWLTRSTIVSFHTSVNQSY
ncbi:hypothetical protein A5880_000240 [Enterococcus sp. 4G2_DIV0659]|uniref:Uncharacterized protein n=1 Tax=Candidatus Enterococcus mansonii TaxID=1834181 RepID=A0A242CL54_9ENTE|nr:hypothetical protein A5880_001334 [Enterococcus sp. 4G2_DIV0659]